MAVEKYGRCPCNDSWISQGYKSSSHKAIDLGWLSGYGANRPVYAWKSGTVVATGTDSAGGVYVVLRHDAGDKVWISRYWHFVKNSVVVKKGQAVKQGDKLGTRGNTGISTGVTFLSVAGISLVQSPSAVAIQRSFSISNQIYPSASFC